MRGFRLTLGVARGRRLRDVDAAGWTLAWRTVDALADES
jgi:hypothetical protein